MFPLTITSVDKILFQGNAESVNCPGSDGELTVLAHHSPLITTLKKGVIRVKTAASVTSSTQDYGESRKGYGEPIAASAKSYGELKEENFEIKNGLLEVGPNEVVILL